MQIPRRLNCDGTIDSICPHCFITIGTAAREADLEQMEASHVCDPARLQYFEGAKRPPRPEVPQEIDPVEDVG